ncbi:unnamed protein product [Darwinula stevensoni]|uniref:Hint domain-containing protein n=1 Tax=Darwinula stevensoni TaxID=69355 RepID=A0A7R9AFN6_9CRUS|nr:unnamed protein product [Darwinula stevensoni]CAG0903152.1 unnamed protein product [Darwinula stevensoni]
MKSSQAAKNGGCFPADSTVVTKTGRKRLEDLQVGEEVLVMEDGGKLAFGSVLLFLDRDEGAAGEFVTLRTARGNSIALTPSHLVYSVPAAANAANATEASTVRFAGDVEVGDAVLVRSTRDPTQVETDRVVQIGRETRRGVFAPLTDRGTILVDDAVASCYAVIDSHRVAHYSFLPVRWLAAVFPPERTASRLASGVHWYAEFLYALAPYVLPSSLLYGV